MVKAAEESFFENDMKDNLRFAEGDSFLYQTLDWLIIHDSPKPICPLRETSGVNMQKHTIKENK